MKIWTIRFCYPDMLFEAFRICAPSRTAAIMIAQSVVPELTLVAAAGGRVADGVMCEYSGDVPIDKPGIISAISRAGRWPGQRLVQKAIGIEGHKRFEWLPEDMEV